MSRRRTPQRSCIACRAVRSQRELLRLVRDDQGSVRLALRGRPAGRGAYLCPLPRCVERGLAAKVLERAFRRPVTPTALGALREEIHAHLRVLPSADRAAEGPGRPPRAAAKRDFRL